ncbi:MULTISPECIES: hypothetical protein [Nostocales]|uniref:Uncharacterized protein n=3 Tax=Nostocales TaxID=1161 RepID=A0A0C1R1R8_9CYAN|nr:hypothetical protein [Tolypothrix bouteillei]KAF3891016.1 hypothetical protein DA73_0400018140 [Tolypothrix bouteillei VB521301]
MPVIGKKIRIASAVIVLMSSGVPLWIASEALNPQIAQAYTARLDLSIDRFPEENYETLLTRAETAARAAAQRSFDQDILVTDVSIMVSVQNYGAIAPVLELKVSRPQWRTRPDPKRWATYFKTARSLLFFGGKFSTTQDANAESPNPPAPPPQNTEPKPSGENAVPPKK